MKKNQLLYKVRKILASKKIIKQSNEGDTLVSSVKLWYDTRDLRKRLENTLKKEWKIEDIDDDLDFDLNTVEIKWDFYVKKYPHQGYGEIVLKCPNQKIKISGKALYTVEESKSKRFMDDNLPEYRDLEYEFEFNVDASNIEVDALRDFRLEDGSSIQPNSLEFSNNKWTLDIEGNES